MAVGYERIKGLRETGQRRGGAYEVSKTKTFDVPVAKLVKAWHQAATRRRWLDGVNASLRSATAPKAMRLQWPDGAIIAVWLSPKGEGRSVVALAHTKLPDKESPAPRHKKVKRKKEKVRRSRLIPHWSTRVP